VGREEEKAKRGGGVGLTKDDADLASFKEKYRTKKFVPKEFQKGEVIEGFIGIDGGSTSTKAVLMSKDHKRRILAKTYQLSKGNPIEDTVEVLQKLDRQIRDSGAELKILGVGTTGYAKDILKDVVGADAALVETVAHTEAGLHFYEGVDVSAMSAGRTLRSSS
jgi:activator of 2-hydroxyglutaryl-CoA dehydratase